MRYIRNISDDQNKSGDTDNIFRFNLLQGNDIFNFGDYPISINIANSSGYILSMVPEKEFGNSVLKLDFNDQSLKSLTPDNYLLEVEVKFPDGTTATFPTNGGMPFNINKSLKDTQGKLVPTVTFDMVLEAVDKKVDNYLATVVKGDKGDKGDTGIVDTTKDYTWTGTNTFNELATFTKPIQGGLAVRPYYPLTTIAGISGKLKQYSGKWGVDSNLVTDLPQDGYAILTVYPYIDNSSSGFATLQYTNGNFYFSAINEADIKWHKVAKDEEVMHLSGDETASGFKKFSGNISTTSNNSMINGGGNNGDLAMVKSTGSTAYLALGKDNQRFMVRQSNNSYISPTDTFTDMFTADVNGVVKAGTQQDLVPLDKNVVHNTGVEDIFGLKRLRNGAVIYQGFELFEIAPYIDFHFNNDTSDFTSRIMENSKGVLSINGVNMSDGTVSGSLDGNASSATKLQTTRNINGVGFDGTSDITVDQVVKFIGTDTDLFKLSNGFYYFNGVVATNKPAAASNYFVVEVIQNDTNGFMRLIDTNGLSFWTTKSSGYWLTSWRKDADDSKVVHNTGTETVAGDKTFTGNNTFTGQTSFWFKQIKWTTGIMQGTWYIQRMGNWVNAKFDMSANTATGTTTLTLPVGYRPLSTFVRELEQGGAGISKAGTVYVSQAYIDANAMTFSYPTNDPWPTA